MKERGGDPAVQTLLEALKDQPPETTLLWGRGLERVAGLLGPVAPIHTLLQDARDAAPTQGGVSHGLEAPEGSFERVVMRLPRSKDALKWRLASAAAALPDGGTVWLAGHQREGIKSAVKLLEAWVGSTVTVHTKRRCRVLVARRRVADCLPPELDQAVQERALEVAGKQLVSVTLPGVFAHGRVDIGTQHLLDWLETNPPTGRVLDLGAGGGVLGTACAAYSSVERVTLVETGWAGAEACRRTVAANEQAGLAPIRVQYADVMAAEPGPYDVVLTNPPFHDGREEDRSQVARFAAAAAKRLAPGGRFLAVCNTHLPYRETLSEHFAEVSICWEDTRFRIWSCRRPLR